MDIKCKSSSLPYLERLFSALCFAAAAASLCAVTPGLSNAQTQQLSRNPTALDSTKLDLARRYLDARSDLMQIRMDSQKSVIPDKATVDLMVQQMMPRLSQSIKWNPDYQNWEKVKAILQNAVAQLVDQIAVDQKKKPGRKELDNAFQTAFASELTADDLEKIVGFYESSAGSRFVKVHTQLFAAYPEAMLKMQKIVQQGQRIGMDTAPDPVRFKVLVGLFNEYVMYQWIVLDPGPSGDRSGLQAIPMTMGMAVRIDFDRLEKMWDELPQDARQAAIAYRESTSWKIEKGALIKGMEGSEKLAQSGALIKKLGEGLVQTMAKVQGLLPQ